MIRTTNFIQLEFNSAHQGSVFRSGNCDMAIMKGTMPTDLSTLISLGTQLVSDQLITLFNIQSTLISSTPSYIHFKPSINGYTTASNSGVATWFWINYSSWSLTGTVGVFDSGADLEIYNTNIVAGLDYHVDDMYFRTPTGGV